MSDTKLRNRSRPRRAGARRLYPRFAGHVGQEVTVRGWVQHHRSKGKLQFIVMRDGRGVCQLVAFKGDLSEADWEAADKLTLELSFAATGAVRADERAPGGDEIWAAHIAGLPVRAGLPHRRERARRRVPDGAPPSVAALHAPARRAANPRRGDQGRRAISSTATASRWSTRRS